MAFRFFLLTSVFAVIYGLLGFNLYKVQIKEGEYYIQKAEARIEFQKELTLRRGQLFLTDKNGDDVSLALNRDYPVIFASPKDIADASEAAHLLAPILKKDVGGLKEALDNPASLFFLLQERAGREEIKAIQELALAGVHTDKKQYRSYPLNELASHVIGFVGFSSDRNEPFGLYGLEKAKDKALAQGENFHLTLDLNLQVQAERVLRETVGKFGAAGGTIIIQEPQTGKILALANAPNFNPNAYSQYPIKNFLNPALQHVYEPGSVFKPFTMAAGIDSGAIKPTSTYIDRGKIVLNGKTIENWDKKAYGEVTMTKVLERSINTGAVFAEAQIGHEKFREYLKNFGFGENSGIDLPDEVAGSLRNLERAEARAIDFATASFGQGTAVTPVQLINAFSAIANGGLLMRPYLLRDAEPQVVRRVLTRETARAVTEMLENAVQKNEVAVIPGFRVAGKTGTAQIPDFERGGYTDEFIHNYVGFAPASDPKFIILIKLDKPASPFAALTVVPTFRELALYVLNYYNIPPDRLE